MNCMNNYYASCHQNQKDSWHADMPIAMAYVPWQVWDKIYDLNKGIYVGTIFPCLDKPFMGRCACK